MTRGNRTERVTYDEWRGNFRSKLRHMGPNSKFYWSRNMQVYHNGTLGTRPWLRLWPTTGQSTSVDFLGTTSDQNSRCQWRPNEVVGELWVHEINGDIWTYDFNISTWTAASSLVTGTNPNTLVVDPADQPFKWGALNTWEYSGKGIGGAMFSTLPWDNWIFSGEATIDSSDVCSAMTWTDATDEVTNFVLYRDRVWGWHSADTVSTDPRNRIYYTNAGSYTTAAAGNYIDIGAASDDYYIVGAWAVRDSLLIAMSNKEWFVFTGTPDAGSLRFVGQYPVPSHGAAAAVLNNAVFFIAPYGRQVMIATPSGVDTVSLSHIRPWPNDVNFSSVTHDYRGVASQQEQALVLGYSASYTRQHWHALEYVNETWGMSDYGGDEDTLETSNMGELRDLAVDPKGRYLAFVCDDSDAPGSPATRVQLYTRDIVLNRPSHKNDTWSDSKEVAAGDTSTRLASGAVRLAPFSPPGEEVRVRQVIVDYHYWYDTGNDFYENPNMRCRIIDAGTLDLEAIDTYSVANLSTLEDKGLDGSFQHGLPHRWVFRFPIEDQDFVPSLQVEIDDIMSIAISRIVVDYEIRPDNHWAGQKEGT